MSQSNPLLCYSLISLLGAISGSVISSPAFSHPLLNSHSSSAQPTDKKTITVYGIMPQTGNDQHILSLNTQTATKTKASVLETPQSISIITSKQLDEQNPNTVSQALYYTAGVLAEMGSGMRFDNVSLRGFGSQANMVDHISFLDGLKLPAGQSGTISSVDPFLLERIEVIKGPSSLLYGQITPGGLVNLISRQPSAEARHELRIESGSHRRLQGMLASSGALTNDKSWQYSLTMMGRAAGTRYAKVKEQRLAIAPAIRWQPDINTTLTISGYYQKEPEAGYNSIIPMRQSVAKDWQPYLSRTLNMGDPYFDRFHRQQYALGYQFTHHFNKDIAVYSRLRYSHIDLDNRFIKLSSPMNSSGEFARIAIGNLENAHGLAMDHHAELKFTTLEVNHTLLSGLDYQNTVSNTFLRVGNATPLNIINPLYGSISTALPINLNNNRQKLQQTGLYLQDQLSWGNLQAVLGIRHDWTSQHNHNLLKQSSTKQTSKATSWRAGLLYLFDNGIAPYASYSTSFEPTSGTDFAGKDFVPMTANQYEIGIKYQPEKINILLTLSAFDIRQKNILLADSDHPVGNYQKQHGKVRSRGLEYEMRGNLTANLELISALTLLDTTLTQSSEVAKTGKRLQTVPNYYASLWANYSFAGGILNGLSLGTGFRFVGSGYGDELNSAQYKVASRTLMDASIRYQLGTLIPSLTGLQATFNISNLFNKDYYALCFSGGNCLIGNERQFLFGLRYQW